jgi:glyoxalase family protein
MQPSVHGIHHVTAISGDPQENLDFYVGVLGMRLVKKSVNQDVIDTYHLFYADAVGTPGTDLTFFPWPQMGPTQLGVGFTIEISFAIRPGSLGWWTQRFDAHGVSYGKSETRFGETTLPFEDPHGLRLALVETDAEREFAAWHDSSVPDEHQLRGMHAVRLWQRRLEPTELLLVHGLGFQKVGVDDDWHRYGVNGGASGTLAEVKVMPAERRGEWGTGGTHHVAWRVRDSDEEMALRERVASVGLRPTPQIDRFWFKSVYFREPGGALFELATHGPGFAVDEAVEHLGERLVLPPWLEAQRQEIEAGLQPITVPQAPAQER